MSAWASRTAVLHCEGVRKEFGGVVALEDVAIRLPEGGCAAIVGPNGSGKSTLLNVLTGFLRADRGRFFAGARELSGLSPWQIVRAGVARTFQEVRVVRAESVLENVKLSSRKPSQEGVLRSLAAGFGLSRASEEDERACQLLKLVGLLDSAHERAGELSIGQQKLLNIACCIGTGASVLLLDEPVAGVSPTLSEQISQCVRGLVKSGKAVVFVEHDLEFARKTANWMYVLAAGRLVTEGTPEQVLSQPETMEAFLG